MAAIIMQIRWPLTIFPMICFATSNNILKYEEIGMFNKKNIKVYSYVNVNTVCRYRDNGNHMTDTNQLIQKLKLSCKKKKSMGQIHIYIW